jgi:hypothetical protein
VLFRVTFGTERSHVGERVAVVALGANVSHLSRFPSNVLSASVNDYAGNSENVLATVSVTLEAIAPQLLQIRTFKSHDSHLPNPRLPTLLTYPWYPVLLLRLTFCKADNLCVRHAREVHHVLVFSGGCNTIVSAAGGSRWRKAILNSPIFPTRVGHLEVNPLKRVGLGSERLVSLAAFLAKLNKFSLALVNAKMVSTEVQPASVRFSIWLRSANIGQSAINFLVAFGVIANRWNSVSDVSFPVFVVTD